MELGDKHQTTPREATNDPGNDNLNALKNAHLTPRAIKAVQRGTDIKNEDSTEDSTTDGRKKATPKPRKVAPPVKRNRSAVATPKPIKRKPNLSTKVEVKPKASPKAPTRSSSKPKQPVRSNPTPQSSGGSRSPYISLIDMINGSSR